MRWLWIGVLLSWPWWGAMAQDTRATLLQPSLNDTHLLVDGQVSLGLTDTMLSALHHGIVLEYSIEVEVRDPQRSFWQNTLSRKRMLVKLQYDSLKETYLLTNLSLQRFGTDRDLTRALMTLGAIRSLPVAEKRLLKSGQTYELRLRVQLERDALPNALRLSSLFDPDWRIDMGWQTQLWTAP